MSTKIAALTEEIGRGIREGLFGASGEVFLTARQIVAAYDVSLDSAMRILTGLTEARLLRLEGKRYYVTAGYAAPDSPLGEKLNRKRRPLLGMILNSVDSPFFSSLARELSTAADHADYTILMADSGNRPERDKELLDLFIGLGAAGIFIAPSISADPELYARCPVPLVSLGRDLGLSNCDAVTVNNEAAGRQAADHLRAVGCTRFAYVGIRQYLDEDPRLRGYAEQLERLGIRPERDAVLAADQPPDRGLDYESLSGPLGALFLGMGEDEKLGIFCYHDLLASYTLQRAKHYSHLYPGRFRIPEDVAVVGFDDLPVASVIVPPLTTVRYQYGAIAGVALTSMLDYIADPGHTPGKHEIFSSLSIRESTMKTVGAAGEDGR